MFLPKPLGVDERNLLQRTFGFINISATDFHCRHCRIVRLLIPYLPARFATEADNRLGQVRTARVVAMPPSNICLLACSFAMMISLD